MKRLLVISLTVLLSMLIIVSCSPDTQIVEDEVAIISFDASERQTRSLTRTNPILDANDFYWYYTATKTDANGLTTNATSSKVAVKTGQKGLSGYSVGPFSYGDWSFTLYGYASYDANAGPSDLAYEGTSSLTIKASTNTLAVTVKSRSSGANGKLELPEIGNIAITGKSVDFDYTKFVEEISITSLNTEDAQPTNYYNLANDTDSTVRTISLASGSYSVKISYLQGATTADNGATYTGGYAVAEETIYVTIADYLTTKIGGDISENNGQVEFIAQGEIIKAKVEKTVEEGKDTVLEVKAAPVSAASDTTPKTTVSIPRGVLETGKSASLSVTSFSTTAIDDGDAEDAEFTVVDTADKDKPILGALDITLTVGTEKKKDFTNNPLTITTVIAKGLNGNKNYPTDGDNTACSIQVKYNGKGDGGTVTSYNVETGELTFTVTHLSTYYVVDDNIKVYNLTQDLMYGKLEDAVADAEDGDTIRLLKDISADFSTSTDADEAVIIDLNEKTLTLANTSLNTGNDFTLRNGPLAITGDTKELHVNSGTLTVEGILAEGVTLYGIVEEKTDSRIKVNSVNVGDTLTMGTMPSGVLNYEKYVGQPITWKVLDVQNDKALVISEKVLDSKAHLGENLTAYYWQGTYTTTITNINKWLNDTSESGFVALYGLGSVPIVSVAHVTEKDRTYQVERTTYEKVFLLSKTEVEKYYTYSAARIANLFSNEASPWYLRTPVFTSKGNFYCYYVDSEGIFQETDAHSSIRIRPAFWINIKTVLGENY